MTTDPPISLSEYHRLPQQALSADFYKRQLEVVCNNATLALFIMDEHQECVYMNPAAEKLTGYRLSETQGRALHDVIHHTRPDGRPYPLCECPIDQAFPQNNQEQGEEVFVHRDGHFYPVAYTASPIREGDRAIGTIIEVRDITQDKLAEQARQESAKREQALRRAAESAQQRAETVLASISDGVFVLDPSWCYTYANEQLCQMARKSREELLGHNNWDLFPEAVDTDVYVQFHRAMHDQVQVQFEYLYLPWSRWFEYRVYPSDQGITVFAADITERKQAREALRESERRFRRLVESNIFGVAFSDFSGGIHYGNDYFFNLLGYTREEMEAGLLRWTDITPPEFLPLDAQATAELRAEGIATPFEKEYIRKDGTRVPILIGLVLLDQAYNQPQEVIAFFLDLTERKQAEAEREYLLTREQAARAAAERANRVKDEFLAIVSHELRSPLNPILGWSKLLLTQTLDSTKTTQALSTIARNAKLQAELIEDLLDVSRILRGKLSLNVSPVDLTSTIQAALETVRLSAEAKSIQIHTQLASEVGLVSGDATRLQQVVWNLLSNAIKFTPSGGRVEIRLERQGNTARMIVTDTGKGIHPDFLSHVFDHFRQEDGATTRKFGGLGLGLAIVHHLVELHGGTIEAASPGEGQGATFTVRLPLMPNSSHRTQESTQSTLDSDLTGIQILVVDDDADTREFVAFLLEQAGARIVTAASAGEALATLTRCQPDALLSDIGMPEMNGYTLLRQVRTLSPDQGGQIPAIALTAYAGEIDYQQAMAAGFQRHLTKPIEPERLVRAIAELLRNKEI
ncbi:PAS domain S-box protein [Cyanobacteria bacterium FACHB-63]|nr:PAS domain S-box protein [Cyanobacteria bacterium FACHB-63]